MNSLLAVTLNTIFWISIFSFQYLFMIAGLYALEDTSKLFIFAFQFLRVEENIDIKV